MSPRKPSSKPAVAVAAVLPEGAPASPAEPVSTTLSDAASDIPLGPWGSAARTIADELIAAAAPSAPLDDRVSAPWSMADAMADDAASEPSQAAIATLLEFLAVEKGIAFASDETPIAVVQTAINALRGQIPYITGEGNPAPRSDYLVLSPETWVHAPDAPAPAGVPASDPELTYVESIRAENLRLTEFIRVGREHGQAVRVFLRDHFGIAPEKIGTAPLLASAIINQFRAINSELVKAKRGGS